MALYDGGQRHTHTKAKSIATREGEGELRRQTTQKCLDIQVSGVTAERGRRPYRNFLHDVRMRMGMAKQTTGKLRHVWETKAVPLKLKLRIYKTGVCSRLVYGSEVWCLTPDVQRALNGCNSRMLSHITGLTVHEEVSVSTRTYAWRCGDH